MSRIGLGRMVAAVAALALPSAGMAEGADKDPYFGTDYDCTPIMTDAQAADVTNTTRGVVESAMVFGSRNYVCSWSLGSTSRGVTLIAQVADLQQRSVREKSAEAYCGGSLPLPKHVRARLCDAAEDMLAVRTPRAALEAYASLVRASAGGPGTAKSRFDRGGGFRGYFVSGSAGGAITMITPGWTIVHVACLSMATMSVDRDCSIDALEIVLRNFRLSKVCSWDRFTGVCTKAIPGPLLKAPNKRR